MAPRNKEKCNSDLLRKLEFCKFDLVYFENFKISFYFSDIYITIQFILNKSYFC